MLHGSNSLVDFKQTVTKYSKEQLAEIDDALRYQPCD